MEINKGVELLIVMPLFNEEESIERTVQEWLTAVRKDGILFQLLLINDGSKDKSLEIIQTLAEKNSEIVVWTGKNQGHGKSCFDGYKYAVEQGYPLIMQLDSDGQCDPKYFNKFYKLIQHSDVDAVYGVRYYRKDGWVRYFVSRIVSLVALVRVGVWVFDPNVPYRIFKLESVSKRFHTFKAIDLFNVFLALYHKKYYRVKYTSIVFRDRWGGSPSVKVGGLYHWAINFWKQLYLN
jgi:dolichol-phosphate mannosyltransferase